MKKTKDKKMATTIALILTLTLATIFVSLPIVTAHDPPWQIPTWCYAVASPNPVGVMQDAAVVFWVNPYPPTGQGAYGDRFTYEIDVTKPDGSEETFGPITSDPVGGGYLMYTPDQVGTYTFVARFLGHTLTGLPLYPGRTLETMSGADYINDTFIASTSEPYQLTVQQESIEEWPEAPLPEEYWTRPIYGANREWWQLAGNWLGGAAQNVGPTSSFAYGFGPESAHIMWAAPAWAGGLMDTRFGAAGYQTSHYDGVRFDPPIILNGKIYYNTAGQPWYGWYCRDLYTGEVEYFQNTTGPIHVGNSGGDIADPSPYALRSDTSGAILGGWLEFGQILDYNSPNQHGGYPYLIGRGPDGATNSYTIFDAFTGNKICTLENVPSGTTVYGKEGSILKYRTNNGRLTIWNSTHAIQEGYPSMRNWYWCWRTFLNYTYDGRNGYSLNVSIPDVQGSILEVREGEFVIGGTSGKKNSTHTTEGNIWALSLEPGKEGTLLWDITFVPPEGRPDQFFPMGAFGGGISGPYVYPEDGVFVFRDKEELVWYGYSLDTGQLIWGPSEKEVQQNYYSTSNNVYNGMLITYGYGGELRAYNIKTGEVLWKYDAKPVGLEYHGFENCPISLAAIADGKIYTYTTEHSPNTPLRRSSYVRCIVAESGEELWKILHWGASPVIADGYLVDLNRYDNRIYAYGKGPSAIIVSGPEDVQTLGTPILLKGRVTDESEGTKQGDVAARFPNGVPAIADEYQEAWMEYVYMDQAMPLEAKGIEVKLETLDPNGNFYEIGTVTSDASGMFKLMWEPPVPGEYTIIATFEGSDSYYKSYAETAIGVGPSSSAAAPIEPEPVEATEAPIVSTEIAGMAAVAVACIIGIAAFLLLRKRK